MKIALMREKQVVKVCKKGTLGNLPVGALGQIISMGIGKAKTWYGVRFLCIDNPHGFMDLTMWEDEVRPLTARESGREACKTK